MDNFARSSVTWNRVNFSTLDNSESMQEKKASSVMLFGSIGTPFELVGAGVDIEIVRRVGSALLFIFTFSLCIVQYIVRYSNWNTICMLVQEILFNHFN